MHAAVWIAAGFNIVVGIGAMVVHRVNPDVTEASYVSPARSATQPLLGMPFVTTLAMLGGFISLSCEIFLFRTMSFASGSSAFAFALTLGAFLVGIAVGARNAGRACDQLAPIDAMRKAATELISANVFGAAFLPLMAQFAAGIGPGVVLLGLLLVYLIARHWGALLPYLSQFGISADSRAGMQTAILYSANIAGCATGAVLTGFVLTDWLGLQSMAVFLLAGGTLCAVLLIAALDTSVRERMRRGGVAVVVLIAGAIANPVIAPRVLENLQSKTRSDHDFVHVVENRSGIITVDTDGTLYGNGVYDGRFNTDLKTDRNGIIRPYALSLFHAAPRDVLMIGLASGSWAQVIASNPAVASLTIVEINPGYIELIKTQPDVQSILRNPKIRIIEDDGRRWLGHHPEMHFDAIVSNTTWHYRSNSTNLLSVEFLELVKQHLNPGGVFFYNTTNSRRAQRSACTVFPYGARFHQSYGGFASADCLGFLAMADDSGELPDRRQARIRSAPRRGSFQRRINHDRVWPRRLHD